MFWTDGGRVVQETVLPDEIDVVLEVRLRLVHMRLDLLKYSPQIHRVRHNYQGKTRYELDRKVEGQPTGRTRKGLSFSSEDTVRNYFSAVKVSKRCDALV